MESKGKQASRPGAARVKVLGSTDPLPVAEKPIQSPAETLISAPAENVVATPIAPPSVEALVAPAERASSEDPADLGRDAFAAFVQSQTAMARGLEALSAELAGLALSGIDATARTATEMLAVKTLSDAIEVNAAYTRSRFVALVGSSAKLSELGAKLAADASQPILIQLGKGWIKAAGFAF
jgi:hypothetical protein